MKLSYVASAGCALVISLILWYQATALQCPVPLSYRIGEIAPSFSISAETAKAAVLQATDVWEGETKRELFVYDESADFTVNFIYDARQAAVNLEESERQALDEKKAENEALLSQIEQLQSEYDSLTEAYEADIASYEARLRAHNTEVNSYNDRGGAPASEFARLEAERASLAAQASALNDTADTLNTLAKEINQLSSRGNRLVDRYNDEVNRYNEDFGYAREFTQGDYRGDRINIYSFSSESELVRVLAHEFGHVLGIGHVAQESALMYYLMNDTDSALTLATADKEAFVAACGVEPTVAQRVRHSIRSFLSAF